MNKNLICLCCFLFIEFIYCQQEPYRNQQLLDTNNITIRINNIGSTESNDGYDGGAFWKILSEGSYIMFDQGIWVIGKIDDFPHLSLSRWINYYSPGPIIENNSAMISRREDSLRYRVYKISKGDTNFSNPDVNEWPIEWGAPADSLNNPLVYNDQLLYTVYNAYDSSLYRRKQWNTDLDTLPIMPLEIHQLVYAWGRYSSENILSNVIFLEYEIINKGTQNIDSTFIGFWTDIDFYTSGSNPPAVDVENQLGYCWSGIDSLPWFNYPPPAVGYTLLYGPITQSYGDSAIFKGNKMFNYKNLPLSSYYPQESFNSPLSNYYTNLMQTWNVARGYDANGNPIINPITGEVTTFPYDGDPVTNTGWIYPQSNTEGEAGFVFFAGPFTLAPNDTQWVMIALVPGLGADRFESIRAMQNNAKLLHSLTYDQLVEKSSIVIYEPPVLPDDYFLSQNYPNPFNPKSKIDFEIPVKGNVEMKVFNLLGERIATLVNEEKEPGRYTIEFDGNKFASGIYFYRMESLNYSNTKKLILLK